ncbi:hypothetical protein BYT27DRAFT_7295047, partial [Phlegmacium glaucopus]
MMSRVRVRGNQDIVLQLGPLLSKGPILKDGFSQIWMASTENCARSASAQAEHMVLITEAGAEVLT